MIRKQSDYAFLKPSKIDKPPMPVKILRGLVMSRFGVASENLAKVEHLILARTGFGSMAPGALNVRLADPYFVQTDTAIAPGEYQLGETLKLQRCRVFGRRMIIVRPDSHELPGREGSDVLELISELHRRDSFALKDGDVLEVEVEGDEEWWARESED